MNGKSRTYNSVKNVSVTLAIQIVSILFSFVARTVFINLLNVTYLGLNGLFSNVLAILSFSELGISGAIIYNMYKPAAEDDIERVSALLNFYKKCYRAVAVIILVIGLALTPFIYNLINGDIDIKENLQIIYILFLINTVASYLFAFNRSIFTVYQREYVNIVIERLFWLAITIIQLIYLYLEKDFYGYLVMQIVATLGADIVISLYARKKYSAIVTNTKSKIAITEIKKIFKDMLSIFAYKIGSVVLHSTSSIITAKLINLSIVGVCSNYLLITTSIESILQKSFNGIVASIGNLNASSDKQNRLRVMYELTLFTNWIYGFVCIMLFIGLNEVVFLWLGSDFVLNNPFIIAAIVLPIFIMGINFAASNYRLTMGFFRQAQFVPLIAALINVALSIILGLKWGLFGIYISIAIARLFTFNIVDPWLSLKKGLSTSVMPYYRYQLTFIIISIINAFICLWLCNYIVQDGILGIFMKLLIVAVISNLIYLIFYGWTQSFKSIIKRIIK